MWFFDARLLEKLETESGTLDLSLLEEEGGSRYPITDFEPDKLEQDLCADLEILKEVIAWTALFHAIFFKRRIKPYRKESNGRFKMVDGEPKHWKLAECLKAYYGNDTGNPVRKNLEFFIPLRNRIEHRHLPELDANILGECQSMLLNFDEMVALEFGERYCLRESLSFSLQLFPSTQAFAAAAKQNPAYKPVKDFIENYRSSIAPEVLDSGKYAFKAFLIQVANHQSAEALPIQFIQYDRLTEEQKQEVNRLPALTSSSTCL